MVVAHLAPCGTAAADLARLEAAAVPEPLPAIVERAVGKLRPYEGWERRMRNLLGTTSQNLDDPDPSSWADTTAFKHASSIRAILRTADAAGLACSDFADLQSKAVLDALKGRLVLNRWSADPEDAERQLIERSNASPLGRRWGGIYLAGVLSSLRTCLHALHFHSTAELNADIAYFSKSERRSYDGRMFSKETYLRAAAALDAFGRIAEAIGKSDAARIRTGAALLAIAADGSPRRGEAGGVERQLIVSNPMSDRPETKVYIKSATSKARRPRILWLRDPTAIRLVDRLLSQPDGDEPFRRIDRLPMPLACVGRSPGDDQLFRWPNGDPMSTESLAGLLRRVTVMAVGKPACYNMLRRANASAQLTTAGRSAQLGRSSRSTQTNAIYHPGMVHGSHSVLAAGRARARAAAVRAGHIEDNVNDPKPADDL